MKWSFQVHDRFFFSNSWFTRSSFCSFLSNFTRNHIQFKKAREYASQFRAPQWNWKSWRNEKRKSNNHFHENLFIIQSSSETYKNSYLLIIFFIFSRTISSCKENCLFHAKWKNLVVAKLLFHFSLSLSILMDFPTFSFPLARFRNI